LRSQSTFTFSLTLFSDFSRVVAYNSSTFVGFFWRNVVNWQSLSNPFAVVET
jgi:hypothetical protein